MAKDRQAEDAPRDHMGAKAAAEYKGVHRSTIYKAIREGRLQPISPNRPYLISRVVLDAWDTQPHKGPRLPKRRKGG